MPESKRFLLRLDPRLFEALRRWADDELRSINAQIEYLLTDQARRAGRLPSKTVPRPSEDTSADGDLAADDDAPTDDHSSLFASRTGSHRYTPGEEVATRPRRGPGPRPLRDHWGRGKARQGRAPGVGSPRSDTNKSCGSQHRFDIITES